MKKLSAEAMKRRAMALGATLDVGGKTFNASRTEGKVSARPAPKPPALEPTPAPDKPTAQVEQFAAATFMLADSTAQLVSSIRQQIEAIPKPPAPSKGWKFTIHRDASGNMTSIDAKAIT